MAEQILLADEKSGIEVSYDGEQVSVSRKIGTSLVSVMVGEDVALVRNDGSHVLGVFVDEDSVVVADDECQVMIEQGEILVPKDKDAAPVVIPMPVR